MELLQGNQPALRWLAGFLGARYHTGAQSWSAVGGFDIYAAITAIQALMSESPNC